MSTIVYIQGYSDDLIQIEAIQGNRPRYVTEFPVPSDGIDIKMSSATTQNFDFGHPDWMTTYYVPDDGWLLIQSKDPEVEYEKLFIGGA